MTLGRILPIFLFLLMVSGPQANAQYYRNLKLSPETENKTIGVRLVDYVKHTNVLKGLSSKDAEELEKRWNRFVDKEFGLDETLNLFFHDLPKQGSEGYLLPLTAFGKKEKGSGYQFVQANVAYNDGKFGVQVKRVIDLNETLFEMEVGLVDRKLIVTDTLSQMKMVFPLGVGSFDEGVLNDGITLLTPRFENAFVDKYAVISKRKKPRYFKNKPFIRITTDEDTSKGHTAIGFHVQPNLDTFIRAFDSHGCMRMQLDDLMALHDLVKMGPHRRLSINVKFNVADQTDHPFPRINKPYKKVLNAGSKDAPKWTLDRDNLVQTTKDWKNFAPYSELKDVDGDTHHEIYDYEMAWRIQERRENKQDACLEEFPYKDIEDDKDREEMYKEYEECIKSGRRRRSLRDRVYRWWTH